MGLDMYAYTSSETPVRPVDWEPQDINRLHNWRKHPDLHGWMERLYYEKGGTATCFNCVSVQLDAADLDRLEADIREKRLPQTSGFFFGASDGTETDDDFAFIASARAALAAGQSVFYSSWW